MYKFKFIISLVIYVGYFSILMIVALLVPPTPDELNRILAVSTKQIFNSAWAPLNFVPIFFAQALTNDLLQTVTIGRVLNLTILIALLRLIGLDHRNYSLIITLPCAAACILSTPQLILFIFFFSIISRGLSIPFLIFAPLGGGIIAPIYFSFKWIRYLYHAFTSKLPDKFDFKRNISEILIYSGAALTLNKLLSDKYSLFFESKSALNNFKLGNNADYFSPFGNDESSAKFESLVDVIFYFVENFSIFAKQWAQKVILYFSPFDYLKGVELGLLFDIVVASAWVILISAITIFLLKPKSCEKGHSTDYLVLLIASGFIYAFFTVKYRYRAPFELLFYVSLLSSRKVTK